MNKKVGIALGLIIVLSGIGFFVNSPTTTSDSSITAEDIPENTVIIKDFKFNPPKLTVKKGTTVTFINEDVAQHNAVDDDEKPAGPDGPLLLKGKKYEYTPTETGEFNYHCAPHPFMKGRIEVI